MTEKLNEWNSSSRMRENAVKTNEPIASDARKMEFLRTMRHTEISCREPISLR